MPNIYALPTAPPGNGLRAKRHLRLWPRLPYLHAARRVNSCLALLRLRLEDQHGSQITDNLGLIVIGIVAVVAIGGLISGLDSSVFKWVTTQLGLS